MLIEKNMFENMFNMITDEKGKTNDNIKIRRIYLYFFTIKIWSWFMMDHE